MGFSPFPSLVRCKSAYVSMNSACVKTLDFLSPTGSPLLDVTPSVGILLFFGWYEEKNPEPRLRGAAPPARGDARGGMATKSSGSEREAGWERMSSYMSRRYSKLVGKKMSKYPGLTKRVVQGTVVFRYRV